jgi:ketosteroid isomerase-like protein
MSADNVETVRRAYEAFNDGDFERALEGAHPDFALDWSNSIGPLKGVYLGREQALEFGNTFLAAWSEMSWDPEEIVEVDENRLIVTNHVRMRGEGSGVDVEATGYQLWTFRDGLAESVKLFQTKEEALAAAGAKPD